MTGRSMEGVRVPLSVHTRAAKHSHSHGPERSSNLALVTLGKSGQRGWLNGSQQSEVSTRESWIYFLKDTPHPKKRKDHLMAEAFP